MQTLWTYLSEYLITCNILLNRKKSNYSRDNSTSSWVDPCSDLIQSLIFIRSHITWDLSSVIPSNIAIVILDSSHTSYQDSKFSTRKKRRKKSNNKLRDWINVLKEKNMCIFLYLFVFLRSKKILNLNWILYESLTS